MLAALAVGKAGAGTCQLPITGDEAVAHFWMALAARNVDTEPAWNGENMHALIVCPLQGASLLLNGGCRAVPA